MLEVWKEHFLNLWVPEVSGDSETHKLIMGDGVHCQPHYQDEVRTTFTRLTINKAWVGLQAKMFKVVIWLTTVK